MAAQTILPKLSCRHQDRMRTSESAFMTLLPVKVCELQSLSGNLCSNVIVCRYASSDTLSSRSVNTMNVNANDTRVPILAFSSQNNLIGC